MKIKVQKIYPKILLLAMFLILVNCSKDFMEKPIQPGIQSDASFWATVDGQLYTLNSAYSVLTTFNYIGDAMYASNRLNLGNLRSDDARAGGEDESDDVPAHKINDLSIFSDNSTSSDVWGRLYKGIAFCNIVITKGESAIRKASDKALINNYIAQAKCLRGFFYLDLVMNYGDVPLLLEFTTISVGRTDKKVVLEQVAKDLNQAAEGLKPNKELLGIDRGRMSNGAALAVLTKLYMYKAGTERDKAHEYFKKAFDLAKIVIESNQFELVPNYHTLWTIAGDFSFEAIIEGGQGERVNDADWFNVYLSPRYVYDDKEAAKGNLVKKITDFGWGFNTPTQDFVNAFEKGDPRLNWSVWMEGDSCTGVMKNSVKSKLFLDHSLTGYWLRKYTPEVTPAALQGGINIKHYRYADLLLYGAEAANEIGETALALKWLNKVRERARNTPAAPQHEKDVIAGVPADITTSGKDELRLAIQHERRIELGLEGHRFYDLLRWDSLNGIDMKQIIENGQKIPGPNFVTRNEKRESHIVTFEPKHKLLPIPDADIKSSDGVLIQNEGY